MEKSDKNLLLATGLMTAWWLIASYGALLLDWIALTFLDGLGFKAS